MMDAEPQEAHEAEGGSPQSGDLVVDPKRKALVGQWTRRIKAAKTFHEAAFKRIREDQQLATFGAPKEWVKDNHYVVPITLRHINNSVAALYAKNPKASVQLKQRLESQIWDGSAEELQAAMMSAQAALTGMGQPDPLSAQILMEAQAVQQHRKMLKKLGRTLEILFNYFLDEPVPTFKVQFKQAVRRAKVCGVAYVKLGFQRIMQPDPDVEGQLLDIRGKIERIEGLLAQAAAGDLIEPRAELEELRLNLQDLQSRAEIIVREGPVLSFPRATAVIVDPHCSQLQGFVGAGWVAEEFKLTPERVLEVYKIDVKRNHTAYEVKEDDIGRRLMAYESAGVDSQQQMEDQKGLVCVWEVHDKRNNQKFTVADGYPDFLREPAEPDVRLERFWPIFPLVFNPIEHENETYPLSDARVLRHPQEEYNRNREALRQHRIANRPLYGAAKGILSDEEKQKLATRPAHAVVEFNALNERNRDDLFGPIPPAPIDPNLYEVSGALQDVLYASGSQEANLGGTTGNTATETSIAENSRMSASASNVDDIDELLSELARAMSELMLTELAPETVTEIVGPGAVWPETSREEIIKEMFLSVKAGSTGRPNKAAELANHERALPAVVQIPGSAAVAPQLLKNYLDLLDIDHEGAAIDGMPSIVAVNAMAGKQVQPGTGDEESDPKAQGDEGGQNAPQADQSAPGAQPQFTTPTPQGMAG